MRLKCKRRAGQSLAEFAIVLPLVLCLLGMSVDLARIVDAQIMVQNAAGEVIRIVSMDEKDSQENVEHVLSTYGDRMKLENLKVNIEQNGQTTRQFTYHANAGEYMRFVERPSDLKTVDKKVEILYDVPILTPPAQLILGKKFTLKKAYTRMVVHENP